VCVRCEFLMKVEAAGFMGLMSVEFFTPSTNPGLLDLMLEKLITSYADTRLDAEPEVLIMDLNAN
jgi:hypothetical protein